MSERSPAVQDIDWFVDLYNFKRLNLSPPYQRYSVWSNSYQQYFIDTILNNYPCPAIFLHKENLANMQHQYHVVDGKQRLTAIFEFRENKFSLPKDHSLYPGKYYDELPAEVKVGFGNYKIPIEVLTTKGSAYLKETFDRLNRNVRKLNAQELRHARHDGPFMQMLQTLVEDPFWADIGISKPASARSMRDIEFVSEIFLLTMHGAQDSTSTLLDAYYAQYDEEEGFEEVEKYRGVYEGCMTIVKRIGTQFLLTTRFSNLNDFYSLWGALIEFADRSDVIDYEETRDRLTAFTARVTKPDDISPTDEIGLRYSNAVRQGANKKNNRQERTNIIKDLIAIK